MTEFNEVIDFAISREREAVEFYRELQSIARFAAQKETLEEFEEMEHGHIRLLEGVLRREGFSGERKPAVNLELDTYLVPAEPAADMTYQDILTAAVKKEKRSMELYSRLAEEAASPDLEEIFQRLFAEESNHKHYFERIYDDEIMSDN
jgi:rubrerythrin